jgi:hypothetical protein
MTSAWHCLSLLGIAQHQPGTPSTRVFIQEARRKPGYSFFDLLHGYVCIRWHYLYIDIGTGSRGAEGPTPRLVCLIKYVGLSLFQMEAPQGCSAKGILLSAFLCGAIPSNCGIASQHGGFDTGFALLNHQGRSH